MKKRVANKCSLIDKFSQQGEPNWDDFRGRSKNKNDTTNIFKDLLIKSFSQQNETN